MVITRNLAGCDAATVQQRLDALDVFLNAAGKDPPYQLRQFVQEANFGSEKKQVNMWDHVGVSLGGFGGTTKTGPIRQLMLDNL